MPQIDQHLAPAKRSHGRGSTRIMARVKLETPTIAMKFNDSEAIIIPFKAADPDQT